MIGPDGANFNDFAGAIAMFAKEKLIHGSPRQQAEEQRLVALYYIQAGDRVDNAVLAERLEPQVISAFGGVSEQIVTNVALPDPDNKLRYFQARLHPHMRSPTRSICAERTTLQPSARLSKCWRTSAEI